MKIQNAAKGKTINSNYLKSADFLYIKKNKEQTFSIY